MSTATTAPLLLLALLGCTGSEDKTDATPTETDVLDPDGLAAPLVRFENEVFVPSENSVTSSDSSRRV